MSANKKELEVLSSRLPFLYDKFLEMNELGIKLMVSCKVEKMPEVIPEYVVREIVEYLLTRAIKRLRKSKSPVLFFLLYERNGLRMDVAYTSRGIPFWSRWLTNVYFMRLRRQYVSENYDLKHRMVEMKYKERDCICHSIRF